MKKYLKWIICIISFIIFIVLGYLVITKKDIYLDTIVYNYISKYISDDLTIIIKNLTHLASGIVVILITLLVLAFNRKYGLFIAINLLSITIFQYILKIIFMRNRPLDINLITVDGYSFPSGHSLTAFSFYGFIIYLIYKSKLSKMSKFIFIFLLSLIILVVGLSRIYLGVHFFTDVIGAFNFALGFLIIYINIIKNKVGEI